MKSINKVIIDNAKAIFETSYFKISLLLMIVVGIYGGFLSSNFNYLEGFLFILSDVRFIPFGILVPLLVITLCTYHYFDKNTFLISRLNSRKEYLKHLIFTVFVINSMVFLMVILVVVISLNLFPKSGIGFLYNNQLNCHNFIYVIYIVLRLFCILQLISILNILLLKCSNQKLIVTLNVILYGLIAIADYKTALINNILEIPLFIGNYFVILNYESFGLDVLCSTICIIFLLIITYIQFRITSKRLGDIIVS